MPLSNDTAVVGTYDIAMRGGALDSGARRRFRLCLGGGRIAGHAARFQLQGVHRLMRHDVFGRVAGKRDAAAKRRRARSVWSQ